MSSKIRASKADQVRCSLRDSGRFASDQGAIWGEIQDLVQGFDVKSPSTAMADVYRKERPALAEYTREFSPVDQQVGAVFVINGRIAGDGNFGKPETLDQGLRQACRKLCPGRARSGKEGGASYEPGSRIAVEYFVKGVLGVGFESRPSVGVGDQTAGLNPTGLLASPWYTMGSCCTCRSSAGRNFKREEHFRNIQRGKETTHLKTSTDHAEGARESGPTTVRQPAHERAWCQRQPAREP